MEVGGVNSDRSLVQSKLSSKCSRQPLWSKLHMSNCLQWTELHGLSRTCLWVIRVPCSYRPTIPCRWGLTIVWEFLWRGVRYDSLLAITWVIHIPRGFFALSFTAFIIDVAKSKGESKFENTIYYASLHVYFNGFGVFIFPYTIFQAFRTCKDVFAKINVNLWKILWKFKNRQNVSFCPQFLLDISWCNSFWEDDWISFLTKYLLYWCENKRRASCNLRWLAYREQVIP